MMGFMLGGSSYPVTKGTFTVTNQTGQATVSGNTVTAVAEGSVKVSGTVTGATVPSPEMTITIYPRVTDGRRVIVVDAANEAPIAQAKVMACEGTACVEVTTDDAGVALFPDAGPGPYDFSAVAQGVRPGDGFPKYESASVIGTRAADVYLPLRDNPYMEIGRASCRERV